MNRSRSSPFWIGSITAIVLGVIMTGVMISGIPAGPQIPFPWGQKMTLNVQLADADALAPHASVEIAGVKIGEVQSVSAQGNVAVATLQIQQQYSDIHHNATVYLRAHGLFGPKYIAILPGTVQSPVLHDGDTISVNQTIQPVDLNAILQDLQAPEQQDLRTFFIEFGKAAAGRGDDFNHLLRAANSLTSVLDSPLKAIAAVKPQLSDMLVQDESFNNYFAQTPLDQLVANSEGTFKAFAANAGHLESLLTHADSTLTSLDAALNGQPGNLAAIIHELGTPGGTIDRLNRFTYTLALFGANLTGKEAALGTDPASQDNTQAIIGAIQNVASAFIYSDPCGPMPAPAGDTGHCAFSKQYLDGRQHYLDTNLYHFPPFSPNQVSLPLGSGLPAPGQYAGDQMSSFASLFAD